MSTVSKGDYYEAQARKLWTRWGWVVDKKNKSLLQSPDFFGMFDFVAVKGEKVSFVQVKSNKSNVSAAKKKITNWIESNGVKVPCYIMLKEPYKGWVFWVYFMGGWRILETTL
jgi:Holliday junction resolvase